MGYLSFASPSVAFLATRVALPGIRPTLGPSPRSALPSVPLMTPMKIGAVRVGIVSGLPTKPPATWHGELAQCNLRVCRHGRGYKAIPLRRHRHDTCVTKTLDQPVETIASRTRLVEERQPAASRRKLGNQLAALRPRLCLPRRIAHLASAASLGDRHCVAQLRSIDPDERFAMIPMTRPPCVRLYPAHSGQPSNAHRG